MDDPATPDTHQQGALPAPLERARGPHHGESPPPMSTIRSELPFKQLIDEANHRYGTVLWPGLVFLAVVIVWELAVSYYAIPSYILPPPSGILTALAGNYPTILEQLWVTLGVFAPAYLATIVSGYLLALVMAQWKVLEITLYPFVIVARAIPVIALIPIIIIWFGFGATSIVMISYLISFFAMVVNTLAGFKATDDELVDMLRSFSANRRQLFWNVYRYSSLPHVFAGLKICVILAFTGVIVGEFLVSMQGIGYLIIEYNQYLATDKMFAAILVISLAQLTLFATVVMIERYVVTWN